MRKSFYSIIFALVLILGTSSLVFAQEVNYDFFKSVKLVIGNSNAEVNHNPAKMDEPAFVNNGRTLVPFRFLGESLGAQVQWDGQAKQAKFSTADTEVIVTLGSKVAYVNGVEQALDVPAESKGGRTFIPLRFVSESLGALVSYEKETKTISVRYVDSSKWEVFTDSTNGLEYKYPAGWQIEQIDGATIEVMSPNGTIMLVNLWDEKPSEVNGLIRAFAEEISWEFNAEFPNVPGNLDAGYELQYSFYDKELDELSWYITYCDPYEQGSLVGEIFADDLYYDEVAIMIKILLS